MRALQWNCVGVYSLVGSVSCHCFKLQSLQPGLQSENSIGLHANLLDLLIQCSKDRHKVNVTNIPTVRQLLISISVRRIHCAKCTACLPACLLACHCGFVAIWRCAVATKSISLYHVAKGIGPVQSSQSIHVVMLRKRK